MIVKLRVIFGWTFVSSSSVASSGAEYTSTGCLDIAGPGRAGQEGDAGGVQGEQTRRQVRREDGGAPRGPGERPSTDRIIRVSEVAITLGHFLNLEIMVGIMK